MAENETVIVLNEEDAKEGFFRVGTSWQKVRDRLVKKLGAANLISERIDQDKEGGNRWWDLKLPVNRLARISSLLKTPDANRGIISEKSKDALRVAHEKRRAAILDKTNNAVKTK